MTGMDIFNLIAGICSIISLVISLVSLAKVGDIQKNINNQQTISNISGTNVTNNQIGRDMNH